MKKETKKLFTILIIDIFLIGLLTAILIYEDSNEIPATPTPSKKEDIKKFSSEEEFKSYLQNIAVEAEFFGITGNGFGRALAPEIGLPLIEDKTEKSAESERVSGTTVQVLSIDEPDIVKTNGKEIYFSRENQFFKSLPEPTAIPEEGISFEEEKEMMPPPSDQILAGTVSLKAFPPEELTSLAAIDKIGDLLLYNNILVIFSADKIYGYDVSEPKTPQKKWEIELEENNSIAGARLYKDKIYLVAKNSINESSPCPLKPLMIGETALTITCQEIYHPVASVSVDATFTAMILDPLSGSIGKTVSFVGSSGSSALYMSEKAIYVTYTYNKNTIKFFSEFLKEKSQDIAPSWLIEKIDKLENYDISQSAKMVEYQVILEKYFNSLDGDERLRIENELSNRMSDYYQEKRRELQKTGIVKIDLEDFTTKSGTVPGRPLNQFALDEYNGNIRVAVTIDQNWWGFLPGITSGMRQDVITGGESANDIYILDKDLRTLGSVTDMGLTEQIYSVRFIEDKGFVVTFRQTDPFYVLDLSDPSNPELKGELKIPGYSSYLHPITKDKILGIGEENWQVKISLFDVSLPESPVEKDKYLLNEGWSEVLSNYHAFLLDDKHQIFFLPGDNSGYVFSYENDKLELVKTASQILTRRALYIDDYLYVIGDNKITVFNEINWEKVKEMEF